MTVVQPRFARPVQVLVALGRRCRTADCAPVAEREAYVDIENEQRFINDKRKYTLISRGENTREFNKTANKKLRLHSICDDMERKCCKADCLG